jgi:disulfide oxidoreductase YuzD
MILNIIMILILYIPSWFIINKIWKKYSIYFELDESPFKKFFFQQIFIIFGPSTVLGWYVVKPFMRETINNLKIKQYYRKNKEDVKQEFIEILQNTNEISVNEFFNSSNYDKINRFLSHVLITDNYVSLGYPSVVIDDRFIINDDNYRDVKLSLSLVEERKKKLNNLKQ